jgi:hypothetical protein
MSIKDTPEKKRQRILSVLWRDAIADGDFDLTSGTGLSEALASTQKSLDDGITLTCETFEKLMDREVDPRKARDRAIKMMTEDYTPEVATLLVDYVIGESVNFNETPEA